LKPNGDCYDVGAYFILGWSDSWPEHVHDTMLCLAGDKDLRLCHGMVTGPEEIDFLRHGHCWLEIDDVLFDFSNGHSLVTRKDTYYKVGKIKETEVKRYTRAEVQVMIAQHEHFGPWE